MRGLAHVYAGELYMQHSKLGAEGSLSLDREHVQSGVSQLPRNFFLFTVYFAFLFLRCRCYIKIPSHGSPLMDPLSVTASIIAILQVTGTLVNYANDVKDAPKDRARFAMEASSLSSLLLNLRYQIEDEQCEKSNEAWTREVTLLGVPDGPLDQYRHALEKLKLKIVSGKGLVKIGDALWWSFTKEEVAGILLRIERLKSLIQIALQMDHL